MEEACRGVDLVFHAAAHKHVPYCEYNAEEAASVNVMGTAVTVSAAAGAGVKQFVLLSANTEFGDIPEIPESELPKDVYLNIEGDGDVKLSATIPVPKAQHTMIRTDVRVDPT